MSWLRYLGLTVPLAALRSYLYMATTATTSLFVLLPIAMITYDQYYKTLIPNESSPIIPLNFTTTTITYKNLKLSSNNNNNNNNNNNSNSNTSINDLDFQGFGLTPFINHNINVLGSATSTNQFNPNFTPYHEKIFQNANDFYIDSPIRFGINNNNNNTTNNNNSNNNQNFTSNQDIQAITPSKFTLNSVANKKILQDPLKSATKRSIALLDTPPRQPHKLSITTKAEKNEIDTPEHETNGKESINNDDDDNDNKENRNSSLVNDKLKVLQKKIEIEAEVEVDDDDDDDDDEDFDKKAFLQTPSKVLRDVTNKPKIQFQTPAKQKLLAPSSPSTIIISSPAKGDDDDDEEKEEEEEGNDKDGIRGNKKGKSNIVINIENDKDDESLMVPPSPTPAKNLPKKPMMGVFSEKKSNSTTGGNQNLFSHFNNKTDDIIGNNKFKNKNKSKHNQLAQPLQPQLSQSQSQPQPQPQSTTFNFKDNRKKAANKAKMQAGMNKFQIVLTDVHTLINKKKKNTKDDDQKKQQPQQQQKQKELQKEKQQQTSNNKSDKKIISKQSTQSLPPPPPQAPTLTTTPQLTHQLSSLQDHNVTMNSSKDHSSIISAGNNSMNTSHFNITTDHSSFEFGGLSSTPNSKFLLDKIFEKPSPQTTNYFLQQQQQQQQIQQIQQIQQLQQLQQLQQQQQQIILMIPSQDGSNSTMPPPLGKQQQQQQSVQFIASQFPLMTMTMSTPQHQGIINYNPQIFTNNGSSINNDGNSSTTSSSNSQETSPDGLFNYGSTPQGISMFQSGHTGGHSLHSFNQSRSTTGTTDNNNNNNTLPQFDEEM